MDTPTDSAAARSSLREGDNKAAGISVLEHLELEIIKKEVEMMRLVAVLNAVKAGDVRLEDVSAMYAVVGEPVQVQLHPPEVLQRGTASLCERGTDCSISTGSRLPLPTCDRNSHKQDLPPASRRRVNATVHSELFTICEGEVLKVNWPDDACISRFGIPFTKDCFKNLQGEAMNTGISFKVRSARPLKKKNHQDTDHLPHTICSQYLCLVGPPGTTRNFYDKIRRVVAYQRESWKGLLHPRKVKVRLVHKSLLNDVHNILSHTWAAAAGTEDQYDEEADDTDDEEPPLALESRYAMLAALSTGKRLSATSPEQESDNMWNRGGYFPCQGAEDEDETRHFFRYLVSLARDYLKVAYCMLHTEGGSVCVRGSFV